MLFPTTDVLTVNTKQNITATKRPVRQLWYIIYLHNFMIAQ